MTGRRGLIAALTLALCLAALGANADEPKIVGILSMGSDPADHDLPSWSRFYKKMRELGWRDGENVKFLPRTAKGSAARADAIMREFAQAKVSLIVTTGTQEALAAKRANTAVPVVMLHVADPVANGIVTSLAHPGGNFTGQTTLQDGTARKQVELISELLPSVRTIAYGYGFNRAGFLDGEIIDTARQRKLRVNISKLPLPAGFDAWVTEAQRDGAGAAIFLLDALTFPPEARSVLSKSLLRHKLPAICGASEYVDAGCLMSYGSVFGDITLAVRSLWTA